MIKKKTDIIIIIFLILLFLLNPTKEDFNRKINEITYGDTHTYEEMKLFGVDKINGKTNQLWTKEGYKGKNITYVGIGKMFFKVHEE